MPRFGQFEVTGELGRGGMGVVYKGFDPVIRREVALKTIRLYDIDDAGERARMQERLEREAQSAGRLSHPNIVTIYQFGYEQVRPNETMAFIAMEYVPGRTLASLLGEGRLLQTQVVVNLLRQAAEALDHAHAQGVIHRDIKPANLLVTPDARLKVADFGVAKISAHTLTMTGTVLGSPFYMSPEQIRGEKVDARTDQYALGVVAFEAFGGRKPFDAETLSALVYQIVHTDPPDLVLPDSEMARRVNPVLMRALAKSPDGRFGTCSEFVEAIAAALDGHERRAAAVVKTPAARPAAPVAVERPIPPVPAVPEAPKPAVSEPVKTPIPVIPIPLPEATARPEAVAAPVREIPVVKSSGFQPGPAVAAKSAAAGAGLKLTLIAAGVVGAAVLGWVMFSERPKEAKQEQSPAVAIQQEPAKPVVQQTAQEIPEPAKEVQTSSLVPAARPSPPKPKTEMPPAPVQQEAKPAPERPAQTIQTVPSPVPTSSAPAPQAKPVEPQVKAFEVVRTAPRLLRQVQPDYTPEARRAGIEGMVGLTVQINEEGVPVRAGVAKSLDPGLDRKAIEAVAQWRFAPATADGKAVAATVNVEVGFTLIGSPGRGRPTLKK